MINSEVVTKVARVYRKKVEHKPEFIGEDSEDDVDRSQASKEIGSERRVKKKMVEEVKKVAEEEVVEVKDAIDTERNEAKETKPKEEPKLSVEKKDKVEYVGQENEKEAENKLPESKSAAPSSPVSYLRKPSSSVHTKLSDTGVSNILVDFEDELPDVIEQVEVVKTKRVLVSIPAGSDLLVSSVGMRLIARHADKESKLVIIVTDDPAGRNMAKLALLGVADSTAGVSEQMWSDVQNAKLEREKLAKEKVDEKVMKDELSPDMVSDATRRDLGRLVNKDFHDNLEETEGAVSGLSAGSEAALASSSEVGIIGKVDVPKKVGRAGVPEKEMVIEKPRIRKVSVGDFELTIDEGVKESVPVKASSVSDEDRVGDRKGVPAGLVGRDFSGLGKEHTAEVPSYDVLPVTERAGDSRSKVSLFRRIGGIWAGLLSLFPKGASAAAGGLGKRVVRKLLFPVLVVGFAAVGIGYWYLPEVFIELDVESIAVNYSGEVTALKNIEKTNREELEIPARMETVEKTGSDSADASGTAVRGEKAEGTVLIFNKTNDDLSIAGGTSLSNGGLNFILQETVTIAKCEETPCEDAYHFGAGTALAEAIGDDYNVASGTIFSVSGYDSALVFGKAQAAFTGGTESTYQVVSQTDIDGVAEKLKTELYGQAKTALQEKLEGTKWVFVESSIKEELDGEVTSDVPAGAEKTSVNVDVKTKSTALYYDGKALSSLIEDLLLEDLGDEESETLELSDERDESIVVKSASVDEGSIVLTVVVSSYVMPHLDEEEVERDLYGKPWAEGIVDLKKLDYVSGEPKIEFYPEWFPSFAKRMPSRSGQITVNVNNVVPDDEVVEEEAPADGENPAD